MIIRVCGKCQIVLTKENTGDLREIQPNCNDCTNKYENECDHRFICMLNDKNIKPICLYCGYIDNNL